MVTISDVSSRIGDESTSKSRASAGEESPIYHRPRYCDPHRNPVDRVLLEIVDTEAIYVDHLRQVIQVMHRNDLPVVYITFRYVQFVCCETHKLL